MRNQNILLKNATTSVDQNARQNNRELFKRMFNGLGTHRMAMSLMSQRDMEHMGTARDESEKSSLQCELGFIKQSQVA
jgi:hypothetical protein